MPNGLFYLNSLDWSFSCGRVSGDFFLFLGFIESLVFDENSVYPDQTLPSVASDLGLHCLSMSLLWDTRHKA